MDIAFDGTKSVRKVLNFISVLESADRNHLASGEIRKKYHESYTDQKELGRGDVSDYMELIRKWTKGDEYGKRIINWDEGTRNSPQGGYFFNLSKGNTSDPGIYKELLRIAFVLLLLKKGELSFVEDFLVNSKFPLSTLMIMLDSVNERGCSNPISITYETNNSLTTKEVVIDKIIYDENINDWVLHCEEGYDADLVIIPFSIIKSAEKSRTV